MKVTAIRKDRNIFHVTLTPNLIERIFGAREIVKRFKKSYSEYYMFGGGGIYYNEDGEKLKNGHYIGKKLDNYKNRF